MQVNKASPNLDDLDLSPLFVQADPGNSKRFCENLEINKVPDTLDQKIWPEIDDLDVNIAEQISNDARYSVYLERQMKDIEIMKRDAALIIPDDFTYSNITSLSKKP